MQSVTFIFLLYITATALVTLKIMQRNTMYYQRFVNWIKGSVSPLNITWPEFTVIFFFTIWMTAALNDLYL